MAKKKSYNKGKEYPMYGKKRTTRWKEKHSKRMSGKNNPFYGKTHTEESREKISLGNKGKIMSEETKRKLRKINIGKFAGEKHPMWGKKHSKETKKKMRENHLNFSGKNNPMYGKKRPDVSERNKINFRIKDNYGMKNKKHSEESKRIMRERQLGKPKSEAHKQKLRETRLRQKLPFKDSSIEVKIQNFLKLLHVEFMTHYHISEITHFYQCDIFIPEQNGISQKTIIECDGCFFHACPICKPKEYTWTKNRRNMDKLRTKELQEKSFRVIRLWEHDIKKIELNDLKNVL